MNDLEDKLKDILNKMNKSSSLQGISDLHLQARNLCNNAEKKEKTYLASYIYGEIFFLSYKKNRDIFINEGSDSLTDQELDLLKEEINFFQENAPKFMWSEVPVWVRVEYEDFKDFESWVTQDTNQSATNTQTQSNQDKFNWLYVVIPMGGVVILLLGIIIFQNWKKKQSK